MSVQSGVAAACSMIYLGMDVHKDSITIAVLPEHARSPERVERLPNDFAKLKRFLDRLAEHGEIRACYEASGAGYVIHRALKDWGYSCEVIAPSLIPKRPGVQRKHDKRDAVELARHYRDLPADDLKLMFRSHPSYYVAHTNGNIPREHWLPIFRNPDHVHLEVRLRVRSQPVVSHATKLHGPSLRLKARGFNHPRWGH